MPPPHLGPNSFVLAYIFGKKHPCQSPHPPRPMGPSPPPTGNPGSATEIDERPVII